MTDPGPLPALDTPPKSGVFVEHDQVELTDEELLAGLSLGEAIDIDDDDDDGLDRL